MLSMLCGLCILSGSWHLVGPGGGGWIQSVAYSPHDPRTVFIGCDVGGFYHSDDGGAHFDIQNRGLRDPFVQAIATHTMRPATLHLATLHGLPRSADGGLTWRLQRQGWPAPQPYS